MIDSRGEAWHGKNTFIHIQQYELIIYTIQLYPLKNKIKYKKKILNINIIIYLNMNTYIMYKSNLNIYN